MKCIMAALAALLLAGCASTPSEPSEYDKYAQLCADKGGVVSHIDTGWNFVAFQCIGPSGDLLPEFRT